RWEPFFQKALDRDPDRRFQSAEEMGTRLRELAQGTPARFVPDGMQTVALPMMAAAAGGGTSQFPQPPPPLGEHNPRAVASPHSRTGTAHMPAMPESQAIPLPQHTSVPPPPGAGSVVPAPPAGAFPGSNTQVSEARPYGT